MERKNLDKIYFQTKAYIYLENTELFIYTTITAFVRGPFW